MKTNKKKMAINYMKRSGEWVGERKRERERERGKMIKNK